MKDVQKKKFIDIRDKYDSNPIPVPATAPTKVQPKRQTSRRSSDKSKTEVKRDHHTASDDSDASQVKKPVLKRVKTESRSSRDGPLSKEQLLSLKRNDSDSFSDDGEEERAHSGALAVLEDTKSRKESPVPEKIIPIFPFKTNCRANQFPESKVPFIDSHCHIDYLLVREKNYGSFASYVESKDFPKNFSGCVANFCDPPAWGENRMYDDILMEDGVWGAFVCILTTLKMWCPQIRRDLKRPPPIATLQSGSGNTAWKMLEHFPNMYIGVTGLVTFGTASDVREVARKVPLERLLIETDAPYMKPSNANLVDQDSPRSASPAMGVWVAAKIAEIRRIELDDVLIQVRKNVTNMYGI
ncbi:putative deoxyribonuclease TATDN2 [Bolinopsis microptera]|uniref:putative deoxyribonuclease TATDN2 n=1 Tax=Bolinopsis microptera TaxID=2820187 RepID=UPI0030792F7B